jgi:hypothetical protein
MAVEIGILKTAAVSKRPKSDFTVFGRRLGGVGRWRSPFHSAKSHKVLQIKADTRSIDALVTEACTHAKSPLFVDHFASEFLLRLA